MSDGEPLHPFEGKLDSDLQVEAEPDWPDGYRSGYVAVVGAANVGKSTLINAIVGEKVAIISSKPQTTRHRMLAILTRPDAQVVLVDTPGLHRPQHRLGEYMMAAAQDALRDADAILFLADLSHGATGEDRQAAEAVVGARQPLALVLNKADLASPPRIEERAREYRLLVAAKDEFVICATKRTGFEELLEWVVEHLPLGPRLYPADQITDREERFLAAELIREQALLRLRLEVPHGIAVSVDEFEERESGPLHVVATIFVERESHKGIVIGAGGSVLKGISSAARLEMEHLLGRPVFLEVWVKVRRNWRRDATQLHGLGFRGHRKTGH